jgi:predicted metallo-beta-lactamase superfamily hydrolase
MKILPVAFDSLGVRSMATYVETKDVRIFIDPGLSISPDRYSLPPHRIELDRHRELLESVKKWVLASDIVIITHYHYDHHNPDESTIYEKKDIFLKHPRELINFSQKERAESLLSMIEPCARSITIVDGKSFDFGNTRVVFSKPVFHGSSARLGYIVEVFIEDRDTFVYTSDVQGPLNQDAVDFIVDKSARTVFVDGPATYLLGSHYKKHDIHQAIDNLGKIIKQTQVKTLVIDHHLLRDINWHSYIEGLETIRSDVKVCSAAGYCGKEEDLLEAKRNELYQGSNSKKGCSQ